LLVRSDSASAISNVLLLNNGPADNNAGQGVRINLSGVSEANSNIRYAYIEAANQTSSNDHYLAFGTNSAAATPTERLRITSAGNVGIGTTSPSHLLDIANAASFTGLRLIRTNNNNSLLFTVNSSDTIINAAGSGTAALTFQTESTERARIDSSGRLLVGTSTSRSVNIPYGSSGQFTSTDPYLFQVESAGFAGASFITNRSADAGGSYLVLGRSRGSSPGGTTIVANGDNLGTVCFNGSDGATLLTGAAIRCDVDGTPGTNDLPSRLVFSTTADGAASPTERMRITNTGAVLINTTTTATNALFEVSSNGTKKSFQVYNNDNVQLYSLGTGTVYSNGGVLTNTNPSDERLKDSIETLGWGLEEVMALRPVSFDWKNNRTNQGRQYGFIAQEVQSVMPELVTEFETVDGDQTVTRLGLEKDGIYAALVKAIQEQQTMIADLQAKVAALEAS
jgi:hypothetical protein